MVFSYSSFGWLGTAGTASVFVTSAAVFEARFCQLCHHAVRKSITFL